MSIFTPHNIQTGVTTSYTDEYLKEALANLGQRKGAKGDGLLNEEIRTTDFDKDIIDFLQLDYLPEQNIIKFYSDGKKLIKSVDVSNAVTKDRFTISENVNNNIDYFSDVNIYHNTTSDIAYFSYFKGINDKESVQLLEVNIIEIKKDNSITVATSFIKDNKINICVEYNTEIRNYIIDNTTNSLDSLFYELSKYTSINEVLVGLGINDKGAIVNPDDDYHYANLEAYKNVFPYYIKSIYSQNKYFLNENDFILGLKYRILSDICIKLHQYALNNSIESVKLDLNNSYSIKIPKDLVIEYIYNDTTQIPYLSYNFYSLFTNIETFVCSRNLNFIVADFETSDNASNRLLAMQFVINSDDEEPLFIDNINVNTLFEYPYIDKSDNVSYDTWFINGEDTNIRAVGKDAGVPNIMIVSYTDNSASKDQNASSDSSSVTINIEHSYTDDNITYPEILKLFSDENSIKSSFFYTLDTNDIVGNSNKKLYEFEINLPNPEKIKTDDRYERLFINSLLILCVDIKISDTRLDNNKTLQDIIHGDGENTSDKTSYITIFYHLEKIDNNYVWKPITNPAFDSIDDERLKPVLDFTTLAGVRDIIPYILIDNIEPDKYFHSFLVFDSVGNAYKQSDQQIAGGASKYYPILKTDPAEYYDEDNYYNGLQFVPKFVPESVVITDSDSNGRISAVNDKPNSTNKTEPLFSIGAKGTNNEHKIDGVWNDNGDYIPSSNTEAYPIFDFKEVLGNNLSLLNRLSIIGLDATGKTLHAYLGNDIKDKNILKLSTNVKAANLRHNNIITDDYDNLGEFEKFVDEIETEFNNNVTFNYPVVFNNTINNILKFKITDNKLFIKCLINVNTEDENITDTEIVLNSKYLPNTVRHQIHYNIQSILNTYFNINESHEVELLNMDNKSKAEFSGIREIFIELDKMGETYTFANGFENTTNMLVF